MGYDVSSPDLEWSVLTWIEWEKNHGVTWDDFGGLQKLRYLCSRY